MMPKRLDFQIRLELFNCRTLPGLEGILEIVRQLPELGFSPAIHSGGRDVPLPLADVENRVIQSMRVHPDWSSKELSRSRPYALGPLPLVAQNLDELIAGAEFCLVTPEYLRLKIGGLVDFEFKDQTALVVPFAEMLRETALKLWAILTPDYGYVDQAENANVKSDRHVMRLAFPQVVGWINMFGMAYVRKYGRDLLEGLPGYTVQSDAVRGIIHQLTPSILKQTPSEGPTLRMVVEAYLKQHSISARCRAPYQL
jgi:hypothetical protein